jgi:hypothetical protein
MRVLILGKGRAQHAAHVHGGLEARSGLPLTRALADLLPA